MRIIPSNYGLASERVVRLEKFPAHLQPLGKRVAFGQELHVGCTDGGRCGDARLKPPLVTMVGLLHLRPEALEQDVFQGAPTAERGRYSLSR